MNKGGVVAPAPLEGSQKKFNNTSTGKYKWWINPSDSRYAKWVIFLLLTNIIWIHIILPVRLSLFESAVEVHMYA